MSELGEFYDNMDRAQLEFEILWCHEELVVLAKERAELNKEWEVLQEHRDYLVKRLGELGTTDLQ